MTGDRGPASKSVAELNASGSWRKAAALKRVKSKASDDGAVVRIKEKRINPPKYLDETAADMFKSLAKQLRAAGLLEKLDWLTLAQYCQVHSRWVAALEVINNCGPTYPTESDDSAARMQRLRPEYKIEMESYSTMLKYAEVLGLTPKSRRRSDVPFVGEAVGNLDKYNQRSNDAGSGT